MGISTFLSTHPTFPFGEFAATHAQHSRAEGSRAVEKAIAYHTSAGRIVRVKQGLFVVVSLGQSPEQPAADWLR
jgi:hypothetical protein